MSRPPCAVCGGAIVGGSKRRVTCSADCLHEHRRRTCARYRQRVREREPEPRAYAWCWRCRRDLPASAFGRNRARPTGLQNMCKACRAEYDRRPDQATRNRLRKHVWYLVHYEEFLRRNRERWWSDPQYRAYWNARNHAYYHADPKGRYARWKALRAMHARWEHEDKRRCFCGRALPAGEGEEEGEWFCGPRCKVRCARFVCGLS